MENTLEQKKAAKAAIERRIGLISGCTIDKWEDADNGNTNYMNVTVRLDDEWSVRCQWSTSCCNGDNIAYLYAMELKHKDDSAGTTVWPNPNIIASPYQLFAEWKGIWRHRFIEARAKIKPVEMLIQKLENLNIKVRDSIFEKTTPQGDLEYLKLIEEAKSIVLNGGK